METVGAVLLAGSGWMSAVGAAWRFSRSGLRNSDFRSGGQLVVFVQARLNFIHDAQIADKLDAAGVDDVRMAVHITINVGGRKLRELGLAKRSDRRNEKNKHGRDK